MAARGRDTAGSARAGNAPPRLCLLGDVELEGRPALRFLPERRFRLIAYLALRADWVSRDQLAALFWPDRSQPAARSNLRKLLLEVRTLALPQLEADRNGLRWRIATDVAEFTAALSANPDAAFALYRGAALQGLDGGESEAFSSWLAGERRRLHAAWREAVLAALPRRDPAAALALARRLLGADPFDEEAMIAGLGALHALGDARTAATAFREYAERLIEELGVEPSNRVRVAAAGPPDASIAPPESGGAGAARETTIPPGRTDAATSPALDALSFIGRERELQELGALLGNGAGRLVTVTGPGGIGKSRLIKQALRGLVAGYDDGVHWIALDDLADIAQVLPRIAAELALVPDLTEEPLARIAAHFAPRRALLVLDNAEHLPGLATLVDRLLEAAPHLQVLASSRVRLGCEGEALLPLAGLSLPSASDAAREIAEADAVRMFVAHARSAEPRFDPDANAPQIARLARAVAGLPLALLLAASWVRLLPMTELANDVMLSLDMLEASDEGEERAEHRSMRATFEQSWRLLAPAEQRALAALSVFAGRFSRTAALAVAGARIVLLSSLVDKSLLQVESSDALAASSWFHLHPLLRHFARGKAGAVDERRDLQARHAGHFAQWLADTEQALRGPEQPQALAALEELLPDCQAAWAHAVAEGDVRFVERATLSLMYYCEARGRRADGIALFSAAELALADGGDAAAGALAMLARALSTLRYRSGEMALTMDTASRGIVLARRAGARAALKGCLLNLGLAHYQHGENDPARACFEEALALARTDRDQPGIGAFLNSLAMVEQAQGDVAAAQAHYREVLALFRELGNARGMLTALNNLALILVEGRRAADAVPLYEEGLRLGTRHGITVMRANFLFGLGSARLALGQLAVAHDLTLQAIDAAQAGGEPHVAAEGGMQLARIALAAGDAAAALPLAQQALAAAMRLENVPVILNGVHCIAECRQAAGDARAAVALWLFIAAQPQTSDGERRQFEKFVGDVALTPVDRAWADAEAQRYELSSLAITLGG